MEAFVMVIDDSPTVRKIMEASLQRERIRAALFGDGVQAMQALTRGTIRVPDAVLVDVRLPKVDGFEVVKRFRQQSAFAGVPILMLSGNTGWINKLRAWRAGADVYLTKPFQPQSIIAELRRCLNAR